MGSGAAPEPTRAGGTAGHGAGGAAARGAPSLFPFSPWGRPAQVTPASGVACWNTHADTRCFRQDWGAVEVVFALFQLLLVSADTGRCSTGTK